MIGISVASRIGVGDALQFSSLPENYFAATGKKLIDISKPWFFDKNPFVTRDDTIKAARVQELWNFGPKQYDWPILRPEKIYFSNAEIWAAVMGVKNPALIRPRLYQFEDFPFEKREMILVQVKGRSHGELPDRIVDHIKSKYGPTGKLFLIGESKPGVDIPKIETPTLWDLASVVSKAKMFIGPDSGPSWVAACYPDVVTKIIRMKPEPTKFEDWVPMSSTNIHSMWDCRARVIHNPTDRDIGFTLSYRRL